jgi:lipopolysaccharide transport system ATP-binding protein
MDEDLVIRVDNVSKMYRLWPSPAARLRAPLLLRVGQLPLLPESFKVAVEKRAREEARSFYALRHVTLHARRGETVGIVGRNGSGKSTLLQIIAGTLSPTAGSVDVRGRLAALLELGSGFNLDFTGRENVYMNAAIMGLTRAETDTRYSQIAAFADIGDFLDQPVRTYSSGMYLRLAFAVATCVEPQVLIVDEALAVGDEAFQRKCFARIRDLQRGGCTILFVSHSAGNVVDLCDRAVLLDGGEMLASGKPKTIISRYHKLIYAPAEAGAALRNELRSEHLAGRSSAARSVAPAHRGSERVRSSGPQPSPFFDAGLRPQSTISYEPRGALIEKAELLTLAGQPVNVLVRRQSYVYGYSVLFYERCFQVRFGMLVKTVTGLELGGGVSATAAEALDHLEPSTIVHVRFQFECLLAPGSYFLNAGVVGTVNAAETFLHRLVDVLMIRVQDDPGALATGWADLKVVPEVRVESPMVDSVAGQRSTG